MFKIKKRNSFSYKKELIKNLQPLKDPYETVYKENQCKIVVLEKDIIVYKKALKQQYFFSSSKRDVLVTLLIPKGTLVLISKYKCRAKKAIVLSIKTIGFFKRNLKQAKSIYTNTSIYKVNNTIYPDYFEANKRICGHGIHFFLNKKDALNY